MFKMTVVASKLREEMAYYLGQVKDNQVLQILHRGDSVKVMMTQQHYLDLLSRLAVFERSSAPEVRHRSKSEIKASIEKRLKQHEVEAASETPISLGRKRRKTA